MASKAKVLIGINAISAWLGFGGSLIVNTFDLVPEDEYEPHLFGPHAPGMAGALTRFIDLFGYFTIWSNALVAITITMLYLNFNRNDQRFRWLRSTSILMITMTGILYHLLIAPTADPQSWNVYTNAFQHYITPVITVLVWLLIGPRNFFDFKMTISVFAIPTAYLAYTFSRGAIIDRYPYGFFDVIEYGYFSVATTLVMIYVASYVLALLFFGLDKALSKKK
ncbi:MAG: Pr6Pr family membrane protein [Candidatus Nanopelagicaceae bacterium]